MTLVGGIDEAGKGAICGPMVIAGMVMESNTLDSWKEFGVKDSKLLSRKERARLYEKLVRLPYTAIIVSPAEIDAAVTSVIKGRKLNYLEAIKFAQITDRLSPDVFYVDSPDINPARFGNTIYTLSTSKPRIISKHHADRDYVVVGAASIIAKEIRDMEVESLKQRIGVDFGSGYPHDKRTRAFVKHLLNEGKPLPPYIRKSWKTIERLKQGPAEVRKIEMFI